MNTYKHPEITEHDALLHARAVIADTATVHHVGSRNIARDWMKQYGELTDTGTRDSAQTFVYDAPR